MIRLLTAVLLFVSFNVEAQTQVPHVFEDATPAKAAEVNANFDALSDSISNLDERVTVMSGASCEQATYEYLGPTEQTYSYPNRIKGLNACRDEFGDSADIANSAVIFAQFKNRAELNHGWALGEWASSREKYFFVPTGPSGTSAGFIAVYPTHVYQVKDKPSTGGCDSPAWTCASNPFYCMRLVD